VSTDPSEPGQVVAFYSFKGGTGRSMALSNVGCLLAAEASRPVLLVDWDLEAPGLDRYFRKQMFGAFRGAEEVQNKSPGLIDLFIDLRNRIDKLDPDTHQDFEAAAAMLREVPLEDYIIKTDIPALHLIKAGGYDREYAQRIGTFDWLTLYRRSPFLLRAFAARLTKDYRYVLIDSRTGLTDTSGICTMLLPEILVAVFTPNLQSLAGVVDLIQEAARYRSQSDDLRPLVIYPLPSRVEASEPALRQQWRFGDAKAGIGGFQPAFEQAFKDIYGLAECKLDAYFDDVQIQQITKYAYGEEIAVLVEETRDRFSLTRSYQRFAARLQSGQLPWIASAQSVDASFDDEPVGSADQVSNAPSEDAIRERAAASYLNRIAEPIHRLMRRRTLLRFVQTSLYAALLIAAASLLWLASTGRSAAIESLAVGVAMTVLASQLLSKRITEVQTLTNEIERELKDFKEKTPPYETAYALTRLMGRVDPLLASLSPKSVKKTGKIYISYRRSDSADEAGRISDALRARFGTERVFFLDVDSIRPGEDFRKAINKTVAAADVMLVVIGPNWLGANPPRLNNPYDFVRIELEAALARDMPVIPVLVGGAQVPLASALPADIQSLAQRNASVLSHSRWQADLIRLLDAIDRLMVG
jgi:MinD-like ATPase involved in chromosome partitioning or flagellar assembly